MTMEPSLQQSILLEIEQALHQAVAQHKAGQLQVAEELYRAILQVNPNQPDANHNMGVLAVQKNQPIAGLPYFLAALDADPTQRQCWISYIDALFQAGQPEEARQVLALARQQGLEGDEVEALALRHKGGTQTAKLLNSADDIPLASSSVSKDKPNKPNKPKAKPATNRKKNPGTQEMNTLSALFTKEQYVEAADLARKMTERYPLHGLGWKALGTALIQMGRNADALLPMQKAATLLPGDIGAHNNLGNALQDMCRLDEAEVSFRRVLQIKPDYAEAHCNLGNNLMSQSRLDEAEASYNKALQFKPDYAEAHNNLGNTLWSLRRLDEAEASFLRALQINPIFVEAHGNLGNTLRDLGRFDEAEASYRRALQIRPIFVEAHNNLAITLKELGRLDEAVASCRRALEIKPDYSDAHLNLGGVLKELGKLDDAVASFRRALEIRPDYAEAHSNLGGALQELGQLDEAVTSCRHALEIKSNYVEAYNNLSTALKKLGKLDEAVACCRLALAINPDYAIAHSNLGLVLQDQGDFEAAIASYRQALTLKPDFREARMNLGYAQLSCGQLAEGWANHELRTGAVRMRFPHQPYWAGENLDEKSILVWGEQGIGDEIMFASQYAEIIAQAGRCVIECAAKLVPLFARSFPDAQVIAKSEPPHPATQAGIDYQCAAGSLARWLRPNLTSFPQQNSFLIPDPARVAYWKTRLAELGPEPKIGFCWRSSMMTGERTLHYTALDQWGPIFTSPGVHFINLQYDECSAELNEARQRFGVPLHAFIEVDMYNDLDETAALIQALDLVISASTAPSAIAAATGVNTWVMAYGISWEVHGADHNHWLPTLRFFSRKWNQNWNETIEHISAQLKSHRLDVMPPTHKNDGIKHEG